MAEEWILKDSRPEAKIAHPATMVAIEALEGLKTGGVEPVRILDMGCGSGILSLMAARLWAESGVLAVDISAKAVAECTENVQSNGFAARIRVLRSEGYAHPEIAAGAPYSLVISNMLAELHVRYAFEVRRVLKGGGVACLSGILPWLQQEVLGAYAANGFALRQEIQGKGWNAVVVELGG